MCMHDQESIAGWQTTHARAMRLLLAIALLGCGGCTHRQLARNTALTATTVNTIQYRMVLDNLALFSCQPGSLPAHVRLADGTVQISNQAGFGESGGFTAFDGMPFGIDRWGPAGSTKVSEQWGTDAVENPIQVRELQTLYRKAFGLPPLPTPNFIVAAQEAQARAAREKSGSNGSGNGSDGSDEGSDSKGPPEILDEESLRQREVLPGTDATWALIADDAERDARETELRTNQRSQSHDGKLDAADFDIPIGWFQIGGKKDVPPDACYVGRYQDRYAWVTADGVEALAQFTLAVLTITKLEVGESGGRTGLMFTP